MLCQFRPLGLSRQSGAIISSYEFLRCIISRTHSKDTFNDNTFWTIFRHCWLLDNCPLATDRTYNLRRRRSRQHVYDALIWLLQRTRAKAIIMARPQNIISNVPSSDKEKTKERSEPPVSPQGRNKEDARADAVGNKERHVGKRMSEISNMNCKIMNFSTALCRCRGRGSVAYLTFPSFPPSSCLVLVPSFHQFSDHCASIWKSDRSTRLFSNIPDDTFSNHRRRSRSFVFHSIIT